MSKRPAQTEKRPPRAKPSLPPTNYYRFATEAEIRLYFDKFREYGLGAHAALSGEIIGSTIRIVEDGGVSQYALIIRPPCPQSKIVIRQADLSAYASATTLLPAATLPRFFEQFVDGVETSANLQPQFLRPPQNFEEFEKYDSCISHSTETRFSWKGFAAAEFPLMEDTEFDTGDNFIPQITVENFADYDYAFVEHGDQYSTNEGKTTFRQKYADNYTGWAPAVKWIDGVATEVIHISNGVHNRWALFQGSVEITGGHHTAIATPRAVLYRRSYFNCGNSASLEWVPSTQGGLLHSQWNDSAKRLGGCFQRIHNDTGGNPISSDKHAYAFGVAVNRAEFENFTRQNILREALRILPYPLFTAIMEEL